MGILILFMMCIGLPSWILGQLLDCDLDIVIITDSSGSVDDKGFKQSKQFITNFVGLLDAPNKVRIGWINFGKKPRVEFSLGDQSSKSELLSDISKVKDIGSGSKTDKALKSMLAMCVGKKRKTRQGVDVPCIGLYIGDGRSSDRSDAEDEADKVKNAGIELFAVGVGKKQKEKYILALASSKDHVFEVDQYTEFANISKGISQVTCPECHNDIMFAVDSSGSLSRTDFEKSKVFVNKFVDRAGVPEDTRIGVINYSTKSRLEFPLNSNKSTGELKKIVTDLDRFATGTRTERALFDLINHCDAVKRKSSQGISVPCIGVVLTDGRSAIPDETAKRVKEARDKGIFLIAVAAGPNPSQVELQAIADGAGSENVFTILQDSELHMKTEEIADRECVLKTNVY